jgi:tubulin-specific chaperone A
MPSPSPLAIATQAVNRLVKEEKYYQKELTSQSQRVKKMETELRDGAGGDGNAEFMLKQEVCSPFAPLATSRNARRRA